jgi:hypothetical protein
MLIKTLIGSPFRPSWALVRQQYPDKGDARDAKGDEQRL